jgi:hypothetical protein
LNKRISENWTYARRPEGVVRWELQIQREQAALVLLTEESAFKVRAPHKQVASDQLHGHAGNGKPSLRVDRGQRFELLQIERAGEEQSLD